MKKSIVFVLMFVVATMAKAQSIQFKNLSHFYQANKTLSLMEVKEVMQVNPQALALINKAATGNTTGNIALAGGLGLIGYGIYKHTTYIYVPTGYINPAIKIGAGLGLVGLLIKGSAQKKAKEAVSVFNQSLKSQSSLSPNLQLGFTDSGLGLSLHF
jgi:hypothetical protein